MSYIDMMYLWDNIVNWVLLAAFVMGVVNITTEVVAKPFLHELVGKREDPPGFKDSKGYEYLMTIIVFGVAMLEGWPFRAGLDVFAMAGVDEVPEFVGVAIAAIIIAFGSKQLHDVSTFFKLWAKSRVPIPEPEPPKDF